MKQLMRFFAFAAVLFLCSALASADLERRISYQGRLNDQGGAPVNATVSVTFALYNVDTGGTPLWSEVQSVTVTTGIFNVQLGAVQPLPTEVLEQSALYLGIRVGADQEMIPRQQIWKARLAQVQGEEIAREAVWPVHAGRNNTIKNYYHEGLSPSLSNFVMPVDKQFIITDVSYHVLMWNGTAYNGSCVVQYNAGAGDVVVYKSLTSEANTSLRWEFGRHDTFRSGLVIPAGATLKIGPFFSDALPETVSCTVAGFEIPATP